MNQMGYDNIQIVISNATVKFHGRVSDVYPHTECLTINILYADTINFKNSVAIELRTLGDNCFMVDDNGSYGGSREYQFSQCKNYLYIDCNSIIREAMELGSYFLYVVDSNTRKFRIKVFIDNVEIRGNCTEIGFDGNDVWISR